MSVSTVRRDRSCFVPGCKTGYAADKTAKKLAGEIYPSLFKAPNAASDTGATIVSDNEGTIPCAKTRKRKVTGRVGNVMRKLREQSHEKMCASHHKLLVFCGPSGSGKSTLVTKMMKEFPEKFGFSVSHTTRKPRPGENNGVHYHFTSKEEMQRAIDEGKFIETATFSGNMYGTSKESVDAVINEGKFCVLDIDVQGVKQIKQTSYKPWYIFVQPPSLAELEARLRARKTEDEDSLNQRLAVAKEELVYGRTPKNFDLVITNDSLEDAYGRLKDFILQNVFHGRINTNGDVAANYEK